MSQASANPLGGLSFIIHEPAYRMAKHDKGGKMQKAKNRKQSDSEQLIVEKKAFTNERGRDGNLASGSMWKLSSQSGKNVEYSMNGKLTIIQIDLGPSSTLENGREVYISSGLKAAMEHIAKKNGLKIELTQYLNSFDWLKKMYGQGVGEKGSHGVNHMLRERELVTVGAD